MLGGGGQQGEQAGPVAGLQRLQAAQVAVQHGDVGAGLQEGGRGRAAGHPGSQHRHLGRRHSGQSPQQDAAAAVVVLQQPGGNLHRHAAADLAEGRHDGPLPRILLHQLVGQGGELFLGDQLQLVLPGGGQVQEPGQRRAFPHALQLLPERPGELERQIRPAEELLGAVGNLGALPAVVLVAKPGPDAGPALHVDPVSVLQEERHAGRRQTDPVLVGTAFLGNSDDHVALPPDTPSSCAGRRLSSDEYPVQGPPSLARVGPKRDPREALYCGQTGLRILASSHPRSRNSQPKGVAMPAVKVRSDYDQLKQISSKFSAANSAVAGVNKRLTTAMDQLRKGDWIGQGAKKFYAEMDSDVMPSMKRLEKAMASASKAAADIAKLMKQAEDESSNIFKLVL